MRVKTKLVILIILACITQIFAINEYDVYQDSTTNYTRTTLEMPVDDGSMGYYNIPNNENYINIEEHNALVKRIKKLEKEIDKLKVERDIWQWNPFLLYKQYGSKSDEINVTVEEIKERFDKWYPSLDFYEIGISFLRDINFKIYDDIVREKIDKVNEN